MKTNNILNKKNQKKFRVIKHICISIPSLIFVLGIEICFFNFDSIGKGNKIIELNECNKTSKIEDDIEYNIYRINLQDNYIKKLNVSYSSSIDFKYYVRINEIDGYNNTTEKIFNKNAYSVFNNSYLSIDKDGEYIYVIVPTDIQINYFKIENSIHINIFRFLLFYFALQIIYLIIFTRIIEVVKVENIYLLLVLLFGSLLIFCEPMHFLGPDEAIHFGRVYNLSYGTTITNTITSEMIENRNIPSIDNIEEREGLYDYLELNSHNMYSKEDKESTFVSYNQRAYLHMAYVVKIARWMNLDFYTIFILGKLANLIFYSLVTYFALKYAQIGKKLLLCICLMPTNIFIAGEYTYDAVVISCLIFGTTIILNELSNNEKKISVKNMSLAIIAIVWGCLPKAVYAPILLLFVFIPHHKFKNLKQEIIFKTAVSSVFLVLMSSFILPVLTKVANDIVIEGDTRGGNTSTSEQLKLILSHPYTYAKLLFSTIKNSFGEYIIGSKALTTYFYAGDMNGNIHILASGTLLFTAIVNNNQTSKEEILPKFKLCIATISIFIFSLIWTALYLSFTPVGENVINGVPPRYYFPICFLILGVLLNKKIIYSIKETNYIKSIIIIMTILSLSCTYNIIILKYCM